MDIFTLCFAYPSCHVRIMDGEYKPVFHPSTNTFSSHSNDDVDGNGSGSGDADDGITSYQRYADSQLQHIYPSDASQDEEFDAVHAKCLAISSATGCLVSAVQQDADVSGNGKNGLGRNERSGGREDVKGDAKGNGKPRGWEFQLSGGYAQVMDARRRILAGFRPDVKTSIRVPAIHILQSIHSSAPASTPLHPSHLDISSPATSSATPPIKPDVRARLQAIEERTGAKIGVRVVKQESAGFGDGKEMAKSVKGKVAFGFGFGNPTSTQAAQPSAKLPWTIHQQTSPPLNPPTSAQPGLTVSDSGRSKSMYPFLPVHQMPHVVEQHEKGEEIQRTDSPECIASPEPITSPLPPSDNAHPSAPSSANIVNVPTANTDTGPWSARSKIIDVPRPRVAGLKSPLPSAPPSAAISSAPGMIDEDAMLEDLKVWGFAEERVCVVDVVGREECVRMARVLVLVLVDELNGLTQDTCEIDHRLQYILVGRKRQTINAIQEETNTNIYLAPTTSTVFLPYATAPREAPGQGATGHLSSPILGIESTTTAFPLSPMPTPGRGTIDLPPAFIPSSIQQSRPPLTSSPRPMATDGLQDSIARLCISPAPGDSPHAPPMVEAYVDSLGEMKSRVWITGDAVGIMNAKEMLSRLAFAKKQTVITKEAPVVPRKLDFVVAEKYVSPATNQQECVLMTAGRQAEITRIMSDNGSFVEFTPGAQAGVVKVYADHLLSVDRTMRHIMLLFAELTLATVFTMPQHATEVPGFDAALEDVLKVAASSTKAEVAYRTGQFQVCGTLAEVRKALPVILTSDAIKNTSHEIRFQCELAVEHRDFMAGKRNGKITKITRATGCQIKFDPFNNQNFLIDVHGAGLKVLEALDMLSDELPAELSFHIPESYHRRIIGKGGASVQDVMRRHSAFVKFSSTEQWATFGGHHRNEDNVICITPNKNRQALANLRADLMMSILTKDRDYDDWIINIDRKYHRALQAETRAYIHHIEVVHGAIIRFLPREDGSSPGIEVFASKYQAKVIQDLLSVGADGFASTKILPIELTVSQSAAIELAKVAASSDWLNFTTNTLQDLQVSILPYSQLTAGGESIFVLKCQRQNLFRLPEAKAGLDAFLRAQPKYAEPVDWRYGLMTSRSETVGGLGHRRGLSSVVYGSQDLVADAPRSAGLKRAGTTGGSYLDGWRGRRDMHKRSETDNGVLEFTQQGNYPPPIARPLAQEQPSPAMNLPAHDPAKLKGFNGRTQSLDLRGGMDFSGGQGGHSRHASWASQAGTNDADIPSSATPTGTSTFPRYKPGAYPRRGVSVYDPVQE
ncbi:hypothetical protein QFC20_004014 [Naganishia adeliensis]|uniref:Uncharacterized protein n=1 Tax=Naganishia adeliensis TaxID=92952 RepID=A0ACC2W5K3_9TREE|nr:hypothetical protein QFC20_004014 [Naganishia adeliensis]